MDDSLIEEIRCAAGLKAKKAPFTTARADPMKRRRQLRILKAFGVVIFDSSYDYKVERHRKRPYTLSRLQNWELRTGN